MIDVLISSKLSLTKHIIFIQWVYIQFSTVLTTKQAYPWANDKYIAVLASAGLNPRKIMESVVIPIFRGLRRWGGPRVGLAGGGSSLCAQPRGLARQPPLLPTCWSASSPRAEVWGKAFPHSKSVLGKSVLKPLHIYLLITFQPPGTKWPWCTCPVARAVRSVEPCAGRALYPEVERQVCFPSFLLPPSFSHSFTGWAPTVCRVKCLMHRPAPPHPKIHQVWKQMQGGPI